MRSLLVLVILLGSVPATAQLSDSALGAAGELYAAKAGTYGELFPDGDAHGRGTPVLALEVAAAGGESSRWLVPGTADARIESRPVLLYERRSASVILMWHSTGAGGRLRIDFATRGEDGWSAVRSLTDDDGATIRLEAAPRAVVTGDSFELVVTDHEVLSTSRRVIHLLYRRAGSAWYTPLVFVDGAYAEGLGSLDLGAAFDSSGEGDAAAAEGELSADLEQALTLQIADEERSVVAAFAAPDSGRVGAVEISLVPLEIELLGDLVRDQIFAESELFDPGDMSSFAGEIRAEIIATGHMMDMHPGIVELAAEQVGDWLEASGADYGYANFETLGDDARELAIYLTGSVSAAVVADPATGDELLEIDLGDFLDSLENDSILGRLLDLEVRSDRAAPAIGDGPAAIFPSRDGRDLLIGWKPADGNAIRYVESRADVAGGAWSDVRGLALGDGLTLERAIELLEQKIR